MAVFVAVLARLLRRPQGVGPIVLPSYYESLTVPEQLLVAIDLERVNRGEDPFIGRVKTR